MSDNYSSRPRRDRNEVQAHVKSREKHLAEAQTRARERHAMASVRRTEARRAQRGPRNFQRLAIALATLFTLVLLAVFVLPALFGNVARTLAEDNPDLMRFGLVADAVGAVMDDRPDAPAGTDSTPVEFVIEPSTGNREIVDALVARELVTDELAFNWVLATEGGLDNLKAGRHVLNRTMSPREVAATLQGSPIVDPSGVPVALRQGLRLEQIVAYLQTLPLDNLNIEDFYALASSPSADLRAQFEWLRFIPEGRSLEGFLGSGIFDVPPDIDARGMLETLLQRYEDSPSLEVLEEAETRGVNVYEMVILASIVEREAILDVERALIAGVYQNRLDGLASTRLLDADPVVIYAKDTMHLRELHISEWPDYRFWTLDGMDSVGDFVVTEDLAGYQVYQSRGLPPGPICTPGTLSLEAALSPDQDDGYLFFLAKGDGSNSHAFARTYEEHLNNIDIYFGGGATPTPGLPTAVPTNLPTAVPGP